MIFLMKKCALAKTRLKNTALRHPEMIIHVLMIKTLNGNWIYQ